MIVCDTCGDKGLHQSLKIHTDYSYPAGSHPVDVDWCPTCASLVKNQKWEELAVRRHKHQQMEALR